MKPRYALLLVLMLVTVLGIYAVHFLRAPEDLAKASADATARFVASHQPLPEPREAPKGSAEYHNLTLHFSLFYPAGMGTTEYYEDSGAYTVLFMGAQEKSFQVFARPYDKSQITQEQFLFDEPSGVRDGSTDVSIDGVSAEKFYSTNSAMGDTVEVWFIHGGFLFEVTTYKEDDAWLSQIMSTWKFI
jgi:hypothetical protein